MICPLILFYGLFHSFILLFVCSFMWQLCSSIPSTLPDPKSVSLMTAKVSLSTWNSIIRAALHQLMKHLYFQMNQFELLSTEK